MEKDTTSERQRKYKLNNRAKGLKRVGVVVPIEKAERIRIIAKRMRENFKNRNQQKDN